MKGVGLHPNESVMRCWNGCVGECQLYTNN